MPETTLRKPEPLSDPGSRKEITMAKLSSLDDLLVHELQDIYHAEDRS